MVNPMTILKLKKEWELFTQRHPKFIAFLNAVQKDYIHEGSIIDITVTDPNGKVVHANLRATPEDIAVFEEIKQLLG